MRAIVVFLLLLPFFARASTDQPALEPTFMVASDVDPGVVEKLPLLINSAISFVRSFPPPSYSHHLFYWKTERKILKGKTLSVTFLNSDSDIVAPYMKDPNTAEVDSFTTAAGDRKTGHLNIMVYLFVDRLFYDPAKNELPNSFVNLVVALAHEIFGNVQALLELDVARAKQMTIGDQQNQKKRASQATVLFLESLRTHAKFPALPSKIRQDFMEILPREIKALQDWRRVDPSHELEPVCAALLDQYRRESKTVH